MPTNLCPLMSVGFAGPLGPAVLGPKADIWASYRITEDHHYACH